MPFPELEHLQQSALLRLTVALLLGAVVSSAVDVIYRLHAICSDTHEGEVRERLLTSIAERPLVLRQLRTEDTDEPGIVRLHAEIELSVRNPELIEELVHELREDPSVTAAGFGEGTTEVE